jgi:hypothetical protein
VGIKDLEIGDEQTIISPKTVFLTRIDRQERFFQQRGKVKQPQKGRQDSVLIAQVRGVKLCFFTVELTLLLKGSFQ